MTFHRNPHPDLPMTYKAIAADAVAGLSGHVNITLHASGRGPEFTVNVWNRDDAGATAQSTSHLVDQPNAPLDVITLTLQPTSPADAAPITIRATRNAANKWDIKKSQGDTMTPMVGQDAASIPYGHCRVVSFDVKRKSLAQGKTHEPSSGKWADGLSGLNNVGWGYYL
jgi:hypothetical protein